jgi:hypothetical protein
MAQYALFDPQNSIKEYKTKNFAPAGLGAARRLAALVSRYAPGRSAPTIYTLSIFD